MHLLTSPKTLTFFLDFAVFVVALSDAADPKESPKEAPYNPTVKTRLQRGRSRHQALQFDKALRVDLWAAEPMLANPVCFSFDEKGRCFVAETFRLNAGVTDNRSHNNWLDDDLASRTVEDRVKMYQRDAKNKFAQDYEKDRDRIRLIEDTTGSGKADKATVFRTTSAKPRTVSALACSLATETSTTRIFQASIC